MESYWRMGRLFARMRWPEPVRAAAEERIDLPVETLAARPCCDEDVCVRKDIANLLDPNAPIVDRICVAASAVARTCGKLSPAELSVCASRLFDVPGECDLAKTFLVAYQTERDALEGQRDLEKRRAAGLA
jgi:hypothetical protein